jgi:uncharacterized membrane protein
VTADSGTPVIHAWAAEFGGLATSSYTDQTGTGETASSTSHGISAALATTQADELLVGNYGLSTQNTATAGTDFTLVHTANTRCQGQWRVVAATGNYAFPLTTAGNRDSVAQGVTLKAAAAGGNRRRRVLLAGGR